MARCARLVRLGALAVAAAIALILREAVRSLAASRPDDRWGPHRKGF